ncbi:hypothetical protein GCM10011512_12100 [Tersicoccus solisilvae]|uniref:Uncharacterized protein n=1 Tax=Tersicoccus solisilvae TaxID=1882339 RepID=A0ABQ1NX03_9MICC|nr:hypothetical protein [Tersicoccus solisilvae]GGC86758.1 hypothetical protein GCM10011512_12100 [Tersicoccus solisilvae]
MTSTQPDDDEVRAHGESPAEGDDQTQPAQPREHAEEPAEGDDDGSAG